MTIRNPKNIRGHVSAGGPAGRSLDLPPAPVPEEFTPEMERTNFMPPGWATGLSAILGGVGSGLAQQPGLLQGVMRQLERRQAQGYAAEERNVEAMNAAQLRNIEARNRAAEVGFEAGATQAIEEYKAGLEIDAETRQAGRDEAEYQRRRRDLLADERREREAGNLDAARDHRNALEILDAEHANAVELQGLKAGQLPPAEQFYQDTVEDTAYTMDNVNMRIGTVTEEDPGIEWTDPDGFENVFPNPNALYHYLESKVAPMTGEQEGQYRQMWARGWTQALDRWADQVNQTDRPWRRAGAPSVDPPPGGGGEGTPRPLTPSEIQTKVRESKVGPKPSGLDPKGQEAWALRAAAADREAADVSEDIRDLGRFKERATEELHKVGAYLARIEQGDETALTQAVSMLGVGISEQFGNFPLDIQQSVSDAMMGKPLPPKRVIALLNGRYQRLQSQLEKATRKEKQIANKYGFGPGEEVPENLARGY